MLKYYIQSHNRINTSLKHRKSYLSLYDIAALAFILTLLSFITLGIKDLDQIPIGTQSTQIELNLYYLPKYVLYTTLRIFAAMFASITFTFTIATLAAKNKKAEKIIIPLLDILQSVPVLGFITFTVTFFINLFPGKEIGLELAAVFAVFTSQAWNMAFSFYQSLKSIPQNLNEVTLQFRFNGWQRFWLLEVPFAMPGLIWNIIMSISGSWFFVVASESISVGNTNFMLPGIGSWLSLAIKKENWNAIVWAIIAMSVVIIIYDQLIFRPIIAWADKFNVGQIGNQNHAKSWVYNLIKKVKFLNLFISKIKKLWRAIVSIRFYQSNNSTLYMQKNENIKLHKTFDVLWSLFVIAIITCSSIFLANHLMKDITLSIIIETIKLGSFTMLRVTILVLLASLLWVPVGVWIGLRPRMVAIIQPITQILASFPANILFPIAVVLILKYNLNPDIWLSLLMILGTQWYIFFNVIAGVNAFPADLKEASDVYHIKSWTWWRKIMIPGILPYYITGALTASGGCWNASIIAEVVSWGPNKLQAHGLGSFIAAASTEGNINKVILGVGIMSAFVVIFNKLFWQRLYIYSAKLTGSK